MSTSKPVWSGRNRGTPLGHRIFKVFLDAVGPRAAYSLLYVVVPWYVLFAAKSNIAINDYFKRVRSYWPERRDLSPFRSYMALGRAILDKVAQRSGQGDRYTWVGSGKLGELIAAGRGGLVISGHVGNWELAGHLLGGGTGRDRISVVMHDVEDERVKRAMHGNNEGPSFEIIPIKDDLSHIYRMADAVREGRVLCMHGDRFLPGARTRNVQFLGSEAPFPLGPFALARTLDVPVCFAFVVNTASLTYTFHPTPVFPPGTPATVLQDAYVKALEEVVHKYPLQWFNYYDFWRHDDTPRSR